MTDDEPEIVKILVVDDHPENIFALRASLSRPDYDIIEARSGEEALKRVLQHDFAVILLDVLMPRMDGFEAAALIRERQASRHIPILFLTATSSESHLVYKGYSVGAVDYLVKPISPDIVKAKVSVFVELYRKEQRLRRQERALREAEKLRGDDRHRFLAAATEGLLGSFQPERQLRDLAQLTVESVADWCVIDIEMEDTGGDVAAAARRPTQSASLEVLSEWMQRRAEESAGNGHDDRPELWEPTRVLTDPALAQAGVGMLIRVPLGIRGRRFGHMALAVSMADGRRYEPTDLVMAEDLAHRIALALENTRLYRETQAAVHARDEFLSIASHELRTPLTTLQIAFQRYLGPHARDAFDPLPPEQLKVVLARSERQVQRLIVLVDKLLDVSRITGGILELDRREMDLAELVRDIGNRFSDDLSRASCALTVEADAAVRGWWDPMRVEQVVSNLMSNAIKYGAGKPVHLKLESGPHEVRVVVRDHGIGISAEGKQRIFGRYERAVSSRTYGGLGLGLYIARQIADAHGGSIEVTSEPGDGSTFVLTLPRDAAPSPSPVRSELTHGAQLGA